jgi:hypothetical protein
VRRFSGSRRNRDTNTGRRGFVCTLTRSGGNAIAGSSSDPFGNLYADSGSGREGTTDRCSYAFRDPCTRGRRYPDTCGGCNRFLGRFADTGSYAHSSRCRHSFVLGLANGSGNPRPYRRCCGRVCRLTYRCRSAITGRRGNSIE